MPFSQLALVLKREIPAKMFVYIKKFTRLVIHFQVSPSVYKCTHIIIVMMQQSERQKHAELLTSPCFSLAVPWQSLISWPICPQSAQGRGLLGLNSSLMMVKFGSWVARPSMIRSADQSPRRKKNVNVVSGWQDKTDGKHILQNKYFP